MRSASSDVKQLNQTCNCLNVFLAPYLADFSAPGHDGRFWALSAEGGPAPADLQGHSFLHPEMPQHRRGSCVSFLFPQSTYRYICRVQSCALRLPKYWPPHPPLHPASVSSPRTKGGGYATHSPGGEGGGGSIFWKTSDIGLASYSMISVRLFPLTNLLHRHQSQMSSSKKIYPAKGLCRRCLSEFIDRRYSQSCWYFRPSFVNCCLPGLHFLECEEACLYWPNHAGEKDQERDRQEVLVSCRL